MSEKEELWITIVKKLKQNGYKSGYVWRFQEWIPLKNDYKEIWEEVIAEKCAEGFFEKDYSINPNTPDAYALRLTGKTEYLLK